MYLLQVFAMIWVMVRSHVFDNHFLRTINPNTEWTHEWASTNLLRFLVDKSQSDTDER
jgi:hypothetical protein